MSHEAAEPRPIGLIGLGKVGAAIASRLSATWNVLGYDVDTVRSASVTGEGISLAATILDIARETKVVLLSLPSPEIVAQVIMGEAGLLAEGQRGLLIIDLSTNSPHVAKDLDRACCAGGAHFLDSPLTGGMVGAEQGTFTAMVGGDAEHVRLAEPILRCFCTRVIHVGPAGHGAAVKLIHNMLGEIQVCSFAEAFAFASRLNLNLDRLYEVLANGMATSRILTELYCRGGLRGNTSSPSATVATAEKDQRLLLQMAADANVDLTFTPTVYDNLRVLMNRGMSCSDVTAVLGLFEERLGVKVRVSDDVLNSRQHGRRSFLEASQSSDE
jgi:3-hydroxyisobutyrate dehydrogenase-like beta-hydroxyacid dehydrogenase